MAAVTGHNRAFTKAESRQHWLDWHCRCWRKSRVADPYIRLRCGTAGDRLRCLLDDNRECECGGLVADTGGQIRCCCIFGCGGAGRDEYVATDNVPNLVTV